MSKITKICNFLATAEPVQLLNSSMLYPNIRYLPLEKMGNNFGTLLLGGYLPTHNKMVMAWHG